MWKVKQIFDGEYGCEEREPGEKEQYLVVLVKAISPHIEANNYQ